MSKIADFIERWLPRVGGKPKLVCALCGKHIEDTAFVMVRGAIVIDDKTVKDPIVFTCLEQAFNYAQGYYAHSVCWINELKTKGVALYDMDAVYKAYNKKLLRRRK